MKKIKGVLEIHESGEIYFYCEDEGTKLEIKLTIETMEIKKIGDLEWNE